MTIAQWVFWGLVDLLVALVVLGVYFQRRGQVFTLLRFRGLRDHGGPPLTRRPRWLSTQPAPNPDAIPRLLAQRMGPFPMTPHGGDWNFFCYVHVAPGKPVTIRGQRIDCRHANLTVYFPEHLRGERQEAPPSLDATELRHDDEGRYEVVISHEPSQGNRLDVDGHHHVMLALRHYVFPDGADIHYPEVRWGPKLVLPARVIRGVRSMFPRRGHRRTA